MKYLALITLLFSLSGTFSGAFAQGPPEKQEIVYLDKAPIAQNLEEIKTEIGYPREARASQITGTVVAQVLVSESGSVEDYKIVSEADMLLQNAVTDRLKDLRFTPAEAGGKPIKCWVELPFEFMVAEKMFFDLEAALAAGDDCTRLDLGDLGLTEIPSEVYQLKNLEFLSLANNQIAVVPKELLQFQQLEWLNLEGNPIAEGPEFLREAKNLKILQLKNTQIPKENHKKFKKRMKGTKVVI